MKNEVQSKPSAPSQPVKTASNHSGFNLLDQTSSPVRLTQTAVFSACVSADSSFRF